MTQVYCVCETEQEAIETVKFLMSDAVGQSAYRQGKTVYVDDGGVDDGLGCGNWGW